MRKRKDGGIPYDQTPMENAFFGQPEDCFDLINQYGTYNVQRTNESENLFPMIAQGLPEAWTDMAVGKDGLEEENEEGTPR